MSDIGKSYQEKNLKEPFIDKAASNLDKTMKPKKSTDLETGQVKPLKDDSETKSKTDDDVKSKQTDDGEDEIKAKKKQVNVMQSFKKAFTSKHLKGKFLDRTDEQRDQIRTDPESIETKGKVREYINDNIPGLSFSGKAAKEDEIKTLGLGFGNRNSRWDCCFKRN